MKKVLISFLLILLAVCSVFASDLTYGIKGNLGFTPGASFVLSKDIFEFEAEARVIGGQISVTADVFKNEKHDLDLGFGFGVTKNMILDLMTALFTLGTAKDSWYGTLDLMVKYTFNFNEHNGIFIQTGIPLCLATITEDSFDPEFTLSNKEKIKTAGAMAVLLNTKIGYKYTF